MMTYGFQQSFRYHPFFKNQDYLNYLKKVVRFGTQEVKTDFIHFDNFALIAETDSCHCQACVRGFRDHLRTKSATPPKLLFPPQRIGFVTRSIK